MTCAELVRQLVAARKTAGLAQADVARALAVTQTAVSYWESGAREIDLRTAVAYAVLVGVEITIRGAP